MRCLCPARLKTRRTVRTGCCFGLKERFCKREQSKLAWALPSAAKSYLKIFLHIWLDSPEPTCALKLPPEQAQQLRDHYDGIRPAYHLNKVHWNDVYLDEIDDEMVKKLIAESYQLVFNKLPRKIRDKYE